MFPCSGWCSLWTALWFLGTIVKTQLRRRLLQVFCCWTLPTSTNHLPPIQTFLLRSDHLSRPHATMHHLKCVPVLQPILISSVVKSEPLGSDEHSFLIVRCPKTSRPDCQDLPKAVCRPCNLPGRGCRPVTIEVDYLGSKKNSVPTALGVIPVGSFVKPQLRLDRPPINEFLDNWGTCMRSLLSAAVLRSTWCRRDSFPFTLQTELNQVREEAEQRDVSDHRACREGRKWTKQTTHKISSSQEKLDLSFGYQGRLLHENCHGQHEGLALGSHRCCTPSKDRRNSLADAQGKIRRSTP